MRTRTVMVYVRNYLALKYSNISCRDSSVVEHLPSMVGGGAGFDSPSIIKPNNPQACNSRSLGECKPSCKT